MKLGPLTISLTVKDIRASKAFYEKLGFSVIEGNIDENWLVLKNGEAFIGIFQGMFDANILTFNPTDVRSIQKELQEKGVELIETADPQGEGAAHITMVDPDGNPILMDQFEDDHPYMRRDHGKAGWVDLTSEHPEELREFYSAVMGWSPEPLSMGDYDDYVMNRPNGDPSAGICHRRGPNSDIPKGWMVYFQVPDLKAALERCKEKGGTVLSESKEAGEYQMAIIQDPLGNPCALTSL